MKRASKIIDITDDGKLVMADNWVCKMHEFCTINSPQLISCELKKIINVETLNTKEWDEDFKRNLIRPYSVVTLNNNNDVKIGDLLYTQNIYFNEKTSA